jgi:hypothetical protein
VSDVILGARLGRQFFGSEMIACVWLTNWMTGVIYDIMKGHSEEDAEFFKIRRSALRLLGHTDFPTTSTFQVFLHALAWAENTLWARPCLSICRVFQQQCEPRSLLERIAATMTSDHIVATMTSYTIFVFGRCCYSNEYTTFPISFLYR